MRARFSYLNHACMRVDVAGVRLLCDPWLEGTAFSGGWGLRYDHPEAFDLAAQATHLWISHWHSDHLHVPSLAKLAKQRPDLIVLANTSLNFSMVERLTGLGFHDVRPLREREPLEVTPSAKVVRFPTAGIDNMLLLQTPEGTILNYNDCNLPARALSSLMRRVGPVDVLLTNYNHAGKLFERHSAERIKNTFFRALTRTVDTISPRYVIPFASSHYYRTAESRAQNASLLDFDELAERTKTDPRFVVLRVGDAVDLASGAPELSPRVPPLSHAPFSANEYGESVAWEPLCEVVSRRCLELGQKFPFMRPLVAPLIVRVSDHGRMLALSLGREATAVEGKTPHIVAHSKALEIWHGRRFGDDTFFAGAHFELVRDDTRAIRAWALVTLLEASHLDARSLVSYLGSRSGRSFILNRREEIWATLLDRQVKAGELRV